MKSKASFKFTCTFSKLSRNSAWGVAPVECVLCLTYSVFSDRGGWEMCFHTVSSAVVTSLMKSVMFKTNYGSNKKIYDSRRGDNCQAINACKPRVFCFYCQVLWYIEASTFYNVQFLTFDSFGWILHASLASFSQYERQPLKALTQRSVTFRLQTITKRRYGVSHRILNNLPYRVFCKTVQQQFPWLIEQTLSGDCNLSADGRFFSGYILNILNNWNNFMLCHAYFVCVTSANINETGSCLLTWIIARAVRKTCLMSGFILY